MGISGAATAAAAAAAAVTAAAAAAAAVTTAAAFARSHSGKLERNWQRLLSLRQTTSPASRPGQQ